ncbi:MAG: EAL domain-containing protein [Oscillospiraceae bacterium]
MKWSLFNDLILEFIEKSVKLENFNYLKHDGIYSEIVGKLSKILNIGKIILVYNLSDEYTKLMLDRYSTYSTSNFNTIYDSSNSCEPYNELSFNYTQSDGSYTLTFFRIKGTPVWEDDDVKMIHTIANVSFNALARLQLMEIFKSNEYYDYPTGVLNSSGFSSVLHDLVEMNTAQNYSSIYLNIRRFKLINTQYSYSGGNRILKMFATNLYEYFGNEQYICHIGGDSFVAIVLKSKKDEFIKYLGDLRLNYDNDLIYLHCYIGIYDILATDDVTTIMNNSNTALNMARSNPNSVYIQFTEEMHKKAIEVKQIENLMRPALKNDEFITYYQPKVSIKDFTLVGAEALVRWKQGNNMIPPFRFVPIFEKNGFISEIDFCMLRNVCKSIRDWLDEGIIPVTISVNFSKLHLTNPNFVKKVKSIIDNYNIPPKYIEIEFTETLDVENYNSLVQINRDLKRYGIKTSIDDFGAGFSSLNLLKDVPVDVVKIDKSLIDDTASSTREKIIVQDIIKMAKTLDIEVIAEGVEDLNQLLFLKNIKCNQIQGYLFDRPLCLEDFKERLLNPDYYKKNPKFKNFISDKTTKKNETSKTNYGKYSLDLKDNFKIVNCDQGFCNIVGYSKKEILENQFTIENFILYEDLNDYIQKILTNLQINKEIYDELKMIKKNGTKIYVMCLGYLKDDNIAEFMISDISVNKVAERENEVLKAQFDFAQRELKNSNYMFEQIINSINGGVGIFLVKENSIESIFCSNSFYNILKCERSEFEKFKGDISKLFADDETQLKEDIQKCIKEDTIIIGKYKFKYLSGDTRYLTIKMKPIHNMLYDYPLIHAVVTNSNDDTTETDLINMVENITILTEHSNFDIINPNSND